MIKINGLNKTYASGTKAISDLNLQVQEGEVLALLGPNGAGKTTVIKILTTLAGFDEGNVEVAGYNIDREPQKVRNSIGCVNQKTGVDFFLTGRENLVLLGQLYRMNRSDIKTRVAELADYFDLSDSLDKLVSSYSGGMQRKLDIATALIHRPKILFLDEPTLGLDIQSRQSLWHLIEQLNESFGLTILLTTHYLEEADKLADRVAIIDAGTIKVIDTPNALKNNLQGDIVSITFDDNESDITRFVHTLNQIEQVKNHTWENQKLHLYVAQGAESIPKIMIQASQNNIDIKSISFARPTLDDVFIKLTGSSIISTKDTTSEQWWEKWAGQGNSGKWQKKWQQQDTQEPTDSPSKSDNKNTPNSAATWQQKNPSTWNSADSKDDNQQWPNNNTDTNQHWKDKTD